MIRQIYNPFLDDPKYIVANRKVRECVKYANLGRTGVGINNLRKTNLFKNVSKQSKKEEFFFHLIHDFIITPTDQRDVYRFYFVNRNNFRPHFFTINDCPERRVIRQMMLANGNFKISSISGNMLMSKHETQNMFFLIQRTVKGLFVKGIHSIPIGKYSEHNVKKGFFKGNLTHNIFPIDLLLSAAKSDWIQSCQKDLKHMAKYHEFLYSLRMYTKGGIRGSII